MPAWFLWALGAAVFGALTAIFAKVGLAGIDSDYATFLRTVVILATLGAILAVLGKWRDPRELPAKSVVFLVLSGLATGGSWVCYYRALQLGEASRVAPVDKFSVVLVALLAVAFLGERPSVRDWLAITLVGAGVVLMAWRR